MAYQKILVVSDNLVLLEFFIRWISKERLEEARQFHFVCSPKNLDLGGKRLGKYTIEQFDVKQSCKEIIENYDLVISAHCKQLFPVALVENCKCINIHPGLNPYNRGWFPQVFSILNGLPLGATIHEIDAEIDHGKIIAQKEVPLYAWDTSLTAYNRVQEAEEDLIRENIANILNDQYNSYSPLEEGNLNLKKDFDELREIKLEESTTFKAAISRLRALTHPPYKNAYFTDPESGKRIFINVALEEEDHDGPAK